MSKILKRIALAFSILYANVVAIMMYVDHSAGALSFDKFFMAIASPLLLGVVVLFSIEKAIRRYLEEGDNVQVDAAVKFWARSWEFQTVLGFAVCYFYYYDFNWHSFDSYLINGIRAFVIPPCLALVVTTVLYIVSEGVNEYRLPSDQDE
jgi:hypothetical protein